jgi:hypothetical protein
MTNYKEIVKYAYLSQRFQLVVASTLINIKA